MPAIDFALSIGSQCSAAHNLRRVFGRAAVHGIFDWQRTPTDAFIEYLQRDFRGMFELGDLVAPTDGPVINTRFGTLHPHEFPTPVDQASLEANYPAARARHDRLSERTRLLLKRRVTPLLQLSKPVAEVEAHRISEALRHYNPHLTFYLNNGAEPIGDWRGDPEAWDRALGPFRLSLRGRAERRIRLWLKANH